MVKFCFVFLSMNRNYDVITSCSKYLNFIKLKPRVANFADMIKIETKFIKTIFKDSEKLKELETMYQNAIYIRISWYSKTCWFPVKKSWIQQNSKGVSRDSYVFSIFVQLRYKCAKLHHCRICVTDFREGAFLPSFQPWETSKRPIWKGLMT